MKESRGNDVIRARIDNELKQEFSDIFNDMSKKLLELVKDAINSEKDKYLVDILELCKYNPDNIEVLEAVIGSCYKSIITADKNENGGSKSIGDTFYSVNKEISDLSMQYGTVTNDIFKLVYKDLINGLYIGSENNRLSDRIQTMYRNKANIIEFILKKVYEV